MRSLRLTRRLSLVLALAVLTPAHAADRPSTAGRGVSVIATPFTIPGLNRQRTVRLYLPPSYGQPGDRRYPVIYMHDGQNLFDDATSYAGEWGVDETLDALATSHGFEAIVVGVDNGAEHRMTELNPWTRPRFGRGEGDAYLAFIVDTLRPWVNSHYRTLTGPEHSAIIGSSMGGLISDVAIHRYPQVFGRAGVLSPAYWTAAPEVDAYADAHPLPAGARICFSMGGREGDSALPDVKRMHALMAVQRPEPGAMTLHVNPDAQHNEAAWRAELPAVLIALFDLKPLAAR
jgi:predicted alpha/beta superfamily hydrolase